MGIQYRTALLALCCCLLLASSAGDALPHLLPCFCDCCVLFALLDCRGSADGPFNMAQHHAILFCPAVSRGRKVDVIDHTDVAGNPEPAEELSPHELLLKKLQSARPAHSEAQPDQARMSSVF